jgi:putative hydrolase of the HAD superfamily
MKRAREPRKAAPPSTGQRTPLRAPQRVIIDLPVENPRAARSPAGAVLLDAYGTLLEMHDPVPRLRALLAAAGHHHTDAVVASALRREIAHYRLHHDRGRDAPSLAALRRDCARVLASGLGGDAPPPERLAPILVESLRFSLFPDALPALDALAAAGVPVAVVSNWDCGLPGVLASLGVADRVAAVVVSAVAGARKPDPAIFRNALGRLGVEPGAALHCGDLPEADCEGARRAGVRAVLLDRHGSHPHAPCPRIASLAELPALAGA